MSTLIRVVILPLLIFSCTSNNDSFHYIPNHMQIDTMRVIQPDSVIQKMDRFNNSGYYSEAAKMLNQLNWYEFFEWMDLTKNIHDKIYTTDALKYISKNSYSYDVIVLNENHAFPYQRSFASRLATELSKNGFNQLALEALCGSKVIRNVSDFCYSDGFYTKEPMFSGLIHLALDSEYTVFGIEECENFSDLERDKNMVDNLINNWDREKGNLFVYCGWDHGIKMEGRMAKILSDLYPNLNILFINQTILNPTMPNDGQDSLRSIIASPESVSVLMDSTNCPITLRNLYDLEIIYPISSWGPYIKSDFFPQEVIGSYSKDKYLDYYFWKYRVNANSCEIPPVIAVPKGTRPERLLNFPIEKITLLN